MLRKSMFLPFPCCLVLVFILPVAPLAGAPDQVKKGTMAGYLIVAHDKVEETYNAGFSMYVAAWPLMEEYPGRRFQTGLLSTWMHAQYDGPTPQEKMYSDIEGGLGWWRSTRFPTKTPAFHMGGVTLNFSEWCNGPGSGSGRGDSPGRRDWNNPKGKYGVAQLSPWVLWPPDGLNLKQGVCGELFGYGYLPLPLTEPKSTTEGASARSSGTGSQTSPTPTITGRFSVLILVPSNGCLLIRFDVMIRRGNFRLRQHAHGRHGISVGTMGVNIL